MDDLSKEDWKTNPQYRGLRPPVKGEIRNPKGRGKGVRNRSTIYREMLEMQASKTQNERLAAALGDCDPAFVPKTIADQVAVSMIVTAIGGDVSAAREVMDSAYGKLTDNVNTTHTFKRMGDVVIDAPGGAEPAALTFDIGEEPTEGDVLDEV